MYYLRCIMMGIVSLYFLDVLPTPEAEKFRKPGVSGINLPGLLIVDSLLPARKRDTGSPSHRLSPYKISEFLACVSLSARHPADKHDWACATISHLVSAYARLGRNQSSLLCVLPTRARFVYTARHGHIPWFRAHFPFYRVF